MPGTLSERPSAEHLAQLPSMPLFAEVPRPVLGRIVRESSLVDVEPGETLIERGTPADALYARRQSARGDQHQVAQPPVAEVSGCPDGAEGAACNRWSCKYVPCCPWKVCDDGWCVE